MQAIGSFVALGDSFTEGVGDPYPDGSCQGWADRFARELAAVSPGLQYANLAIRGKLLGQVVSEQVPAAAALAPDLVSLAAGGNDLLRRKTDLDRLAATFEQGVAALRAAGTGANRSPRAPWPPPVRASGPEPGARTCAGRGS